MALFARITIPTLLLVAGGCGGGGYFQTHPVVDMLPGRFAAPPDPDNPRQLPMFTGSGVPIDWNHVINAIDWADIIVVGEQHDDSVGHAVELAIVQDTLLHSPRSAVSLEMLERDEQPLVDDYLDEIIDAAMFAKLTFSENWAGEGSWQKWYQPIIDAAKHAGASVVAANAPRRYVRIARTDGYQPLIRLPASRRRFFDLPIGEPSAEYRRRFLDVMREAATQSATLPTTQPASQPATEPETQPMSQPATQPVAPPVHGTGTSMRSQSLWDATMAGSIVAARRQGADKVIHLVGQFHCDFEGGIVQQIRRRAPHARILVVSLQRHDETAFRDEDKGRADVVIYIGKPADN